MAKRVKSKGSLRNLAQYKNLSDEEFDIVWEERQAKALTTFKPKQELEDRILDMMELFREDYALDDLKFNDTQVLRALIRALLTLSDYEDTLYDEQQEGVGADNLRVVGELNKFISALRKDISDMQRDLNITRKTRKEEKEDSIEAYIKNIQEKADRFYKNKVYRAICPECGMMLFDGWFLYPDEDNKLIVECGRMVERKEEDEAVKCTGRLELTSSELRDLQEEYKDKFPEGL
ncbi:MAG: hypothetical protein ACTSWJ_12615 [Candidatus Heimdallarchaeaceae archaeon]